MNSQWWATASDARVDKLIHHQTMHHDYYLNAPGTEQNKTQTAQPVLVLPAPALVFTWLEVAATEVAAAEV